MFKPHVTVACVVHAKGKFLVVEETINGKALWNQPAGHLEADETLVQAAERELWEETGIRATPQHFLRLHQWIAPDRTPFLRFLFTIELNESSPSVPPAQGMTFYAVSCFIKKRFVYGWECSGKPAAMVQNCADV
ncbi:NUDIX domain-containing protein, partial [Escherichia coli]|uniref:NUDIX domain-containing protein n=1 Tax=Escherichia coli TaxID=562 RepID=UPI001FCEF794